MREKESESDYGRVKWASVSASSWGLPWDEDEGQDSPVKVPKAHKHSPLSRPVAQGSHLQLKDFFF